MKRYLTIISAIILAYCLPAAGQQADSSKVIKGFSGGMMVHTGYLSGGDMPGSTFAPQGATFGIGGVARLHFTKHFRAGFEGYFSNMPITEGTAKGSYNKVFWAGALVDWFWKAGRLYPYTGITVGGGTETSFYMFEGDKHSWEPKDNVIFHKQPFFAIDPFIGVEYKVSTALRLTLKADWLTAIRSEGINRPYGPRLYFGFIFAH